MSPGESESTKSWFGDARRRRSEELAFLAAQACYRGDPVFIGMYEEAAHLEKAVALEVPLNLQRVRSVLAISAVTLYQRAGQHAEARAAARAFLERPEGLTKQGQDDLTKALL